MTSRLIKGTSVSVRLDRVVDGDTIKIFLPNAEKSESIRILSLDTEESFALSSKPMTPWGKAAKTFATSFFAATEMVTIEFPDTVPVEEALVKHRGNFGRLLVFVHKDEVDFTEVMIRRGYSPYFTKYGNAVFSSHHRRYVAAERAAQGAGIGVWDQLTVNGAVRRAYPQLVAWWSLRASVIELFRRVRRVDASLLDVREDYARIAQLAQGGQVATVFTEVRSIRRTRSDNAVVSIGNDDRPFSLLIRDVDDDDSEGGRVMSLLNNRYIAEGEFVPRRGYCFVTGRLSLFRGNPQMEVTSPGAITDVPRARALDDDEVNAGVRNMGGNGVDDSGVDVGLLAARLPRMSARLAAALPDPVGRDRGREKVWLRAVRPDGDNGDERGRVSVEGWRVRDSSGRELRLDGEVLEGERREVRVTGSKGNLVLRNSGDELFLLDGRGRIVDMAQYTADDVRAGVVVEFDEE